MPTATTVREYKRMRAWTYAIFYSLLIVFMSHQPGRPDIQLPFPYFDKLVHFIEYFVFATFWQRALSYHVKGSLVWWGLGITALFGASDEFHQHFVAYRSCDIFDWLADMAGASAACLAYHWLHPERRRKEKEELIS